MVPVPTYVFVLGWITAALIGWAAGALIGVVACLIAKRGTRGLLSDGFLGSFSYLAGLVVALIMPWPSTSTNEQLPNGVAVTSIMRGNQHPERIAIFFAVLLPLLLELYRFKRDHKN